MRAMQRLKLKVLGLSEMRWNGTGSFMKEGHTVLYSGNDKHSNGVGFIVDRSCSKIIKGFFGISDRVAVLKIRTTHADMCLIQVYAPTSDFTEENLSQFYRQLAEAMKLSKQRCYW